MQQVGELMEFKAQYENFSIIIKLKFVRNYEKGALPHWRLQSSRDFTRVTRQQQFTKFPKGSIGQRQSHYNNFLSFCSKKFAYRTIVGGSFLLIPASWVNCY